MRAYSLEESEINSKLFETAKRQMAQYLVNKYREAKVPLVKRAFLGVKIKCTDIERAMNDNTNVHLKKLLIDTINTKTKNPDHINESQIRIDKVDKDGKLLSTSSTEPESYDNLVDTYSGLLVDHLVNKLLPTPRRPPRNYHDEPEIEKLFKMVNPATPEGYYVLHLKPKHIRKLNQYLRKSNSPQARNTNTTLN